MAVERDIRGHVFGRWTALHIARRDQWLCRCACGVERQVNKGNLMTGKSRSCGCLHTDNLRARNTVHGQCPRAGRTQVYECWNAIKNRCANPSNISYRYYGGRGITVCERWANSFEAFYADMGDPPTSQHSIDRWPNNDGDYEPGNCRWATKKEQAANRRIAAPHSR